MGIYLQRALLALFFVCTLLSVSVAAAATRYVATAGNNTGNDCTDSSAPCRDIQYAVDQAGAGDTVSVAPGTYQESVYIDHSLTLYGAGSSGTGKTTISGSTSQQSGPSIEIDGGETAINVTISDLDVSGNSQDDGIYAYSAVVGVSGSVVSGNYGEGISLDGASEATIEGCTVSGNGDGGVIVYEGSADIHDSTMDGNTGAGVVVDGDGAQVNITNSTVSNTVSFSDGERDGYGGGVLVFPGGVAKIDTSTISGNVGQGILAWDAEVTVANSTISGTLPANADGDGSEGLPTGGIAINEQVLERVRTGAPTSDRSTGGWRLAPRRHAAQGSTQALSATIPTVTGTIIAAQAATVPDCSGTIGDGGYNLDSDGSCMLTTAGSQSNADAQLGALADNGGLTKTLLPAATSPTLDAIPAGQAGCTPGATDQRGIGRPQPSGGACDIGAVEAQQVALSVTVGEHGSVTAAADPSPIGSGISTCSDATCTAHYDSEAGAPVVVLTAAADAHWHVAWSGDCIDNDDGTATVTLDADKVCAATFAMDQFTVTPQVTGGGSLTPSEPQLVDYGSTASFTVAPATGWHIAGVTGCGGSLGGSTFTTAAISADCTVTATFATDTHSIGGTVSGLAGIGLTLSLDSTPLVITGTTAASQTLPISGNGSFAFALPLDYGSDYSVSVAAQPDGPAQTCTVANGTGTVGISDVTNVQVTCATVTHTVSALVSDGEGTLTPATQSVADGAAATLAVVPATGWHVASVTGCGGSLSGSSYTTDAVTVDCTVTASFAIDSVTVTAVVNGGQGTISPPTQSVDYGSPAAFTLAAENGWHVSSATGCGGSLSGNTYTTAPITAPCTVQVVFAQSLQPTVPVPALDRRTLLLLALAVMLLASTGLRRR